MRAGTEQSAETSRAELLMEKEDRQTMRRAARPTVTTADAGAKQSRENETVIKFTSPASETVSIVKLQQGQRAQAASNAPDGNAKPLGGGYFRKCACLLLALCHLTSSALIPLQSVSILLKSDKK